MDPGQIYDSMPKEAQDMPRAEFCRRFKEATDPRRAQRDLSRIVHGKREKATIDLALERGKKKN
jgi:hypothetical protein